MAHNSKRNITKSDFSPVFRHFVNVLINRVVVDNLPEEINEKFLLYHVLLFGRVLFFKKNGKYHVMWFSGKGKMNEYYIQKEFLIVNPWATETNGDYNESNACILYSDINAYIENADVGLYDFCHNYSEIINSIDASIRALAKNSKVIAFLTGSTNSFVTSAKQMINNLINSDNCIGIMEESLVDSIKCNPISQHMDYKFSELIKARQYYISDFYQKLGISANMNMKAERLTDNESQLIDSVSDIDFEHIIDNLNFSVQKINEMFDLNISFRLNEDEEVVDNSSLIDDSSMNDIGDENGNNTQTDNEGNTTPQNESGVQGNEPRPSTPVSETSSDGDGSSDSNRTEQSEEDSNEIEININIETENGDINNEVSTDDESVVDNSESETSSEEEKEDEGITKYTEERG